MRNDSLSSIISFNSQCLQVKSKTFRKPPHECESEQSNEGAHKTSGNGKDKTTIFEQKVRDNSQEFNLSQGGYFIKTQKQVDSLRTQTRMNRNGQKSILNDWYYSSGI